MVKLSPKALRFAEKATRHVAQRHPFNSKRRAVWRRWSETRLADGAQTDSTGKYIEVPVPVALLFVDTVALMISALQTQPPQDDDLDLENDLEFLCAIQDSLRLALRSADVGAAR